MFKRRLRVKIVLRLLNPYPDTSLQHETRDGGLA